MKDLKYNKSGLFIVILASVIVVIVSISSVIYVGKKVSDVERKNLLQQVQNISVAIDPNDIKVLSGNESDIDNSQYQKLKQTLKRANDVNFDIHFSYLMGLHDGQEFFLVDSEDPSSKDYSPPGQAYTESTEEDLYNHRNGIAYTSGPYTDAWGSWISAYTPIFGESGKVEAMLGIDISARDFINRVHTAQYVVVAMSLLVFISVLLLISIILRSFEYARNLETVNQDLQQSKDFLTLSEELAGLGHFTWNSNNNIVVLNKTMMKILNTEHTKLSLEEFMAFVSHEDIERIKKDTVNSYKDQEFIKLKYNIMNGDQKKKVSSICKLKFDSKGTILHAICTAQTIED